MRAKSFFNKKNLHVINVYFKPLINKELLIAFYLLSFIIGFATQYYYAFYNEYRVIQIVLLLIFGWGALFYHHRLFSKVELLFLSFLTIGAFFWQQPIFVITELLLAYLLYKNFQLLNYNHLVTKTIVLSNFLLFLLFPLSLFEYVQTGIYNAIWYPLPWNIRVYDSYFLIVSILATWLYLTEKKYKISYLIILFLAFFAVLLDSGRSVSIAYTLFIAIVSMGYPKIRSHLVLTYAASWLAYLSVTYAASLVSINGSEGLSLQIARESSSGRIDLWVNAYQCWLQQPILGCGFYQLAQYPNLSAHPHNLFIQVLTETGLLGFGFLFYLILMIIQQIDWSQPQRYFLMAAFLAVGVDLFFSGVHIYPVTQMALLWLFVFLLKNPKFAHSSHFNQVITHRQSMTYQMLAVLICLVISLWFIYLLSNTNALSSETPITPPRFWVYGYQL